MNKGSRHAQTRLRPLQTSFTRRTALRLIGGGVAGTALTAAGGLSQIMGLVGTVPIDVWADDTPVNPVYGAGIFDVDPSQGTVSQSTSVVVTGDVTVKALQRHVGASVDGIWGPDTTKHLQTALNYGRF